MAFASAHFAVGMACGGTLAVALVAMRRGRAPQLIPLAMTLGGAWATIPDWPRIWRDYPSLPFSTLLGSMDLEHRLHAIGDLFFFHHALDKQPSEYAVVGLVAVVALYNLALIALPVIKRIAPKRAAGAGPNAGDARQTERRPRA